MDALEYKSFTFTAYHHVKKIPQPLSMQEILDVISPYLQPSTYFMQMSRVHGIFVCGPLQPRPQGAFPKAREKRPGDEVGSFAVLCG